jgi:uncharacterized protein with von Willebrand factor type A (vWA) domain
MSGRTGARDTRLAGAAGELTGSTRQWAFGDTEPWDVTRTILNAMRRDADVAARPEGNRVHIQLEDVEIVETETRTQAAVALLADTSFSMAAEGRWLPMKRTALALHHLVSTRWRGDQLDLITFGRYAESVAAEQLVGLPALRDQGTNLHHALLLAERMFRKHPTMQPVVLIVTDGEPTAYLAPDGDSLFTYPPSLATLRATVTQLDRVRRLGARITFFRLGDDPGLESFVRQMADRVDGRVVNPDLDDLGAAVVSEYLSARRADLGNYWGM